LITVVFSELASSIITIIYWVLSFVAGKTFQDMGTLLGNDGLYWVCGGICVLGSLFILVFVPETKGKSAEDIQKYFGYVQREEEAEADGQLSRHSTVSDTAKASTNHGFQLS